MNTPSNQENLSASRGTSAGIRFFQLFCRTFGIRHACNFVWFVSFFYALFDRTAAADAKPYLSRRFPECGFLKMFLHRWALFTSQGQDLICAFAVFQEKLEIRKENWESFLKLLHGKKGILLLCSHFGPWQAMMRSIDPREKHVNLLEKPDRNSNVRKFAAIPDMVDQISILSTDDAMGGLMDVYQALERGEVVCMMGDRVREQESAELPFLGEPARFPIGAFYIAARAGVPIVPVFAWQHENRTGITVRFCDPIHPVMQGRSRKSLAPFAEQYCSLLQDMIEKHPYQCYLFEDPWSRK